MEGVSDLNSNLECYLVCQCNKKKFFDLFYFIFKNIFNNWEINDHRFLNNFNDLAFLL